MHAHKTEAASQVSVQPHHAARPMKVVFDREGSPWLCDKAADEKTDLENQGCWRCGDLAFTRND